MERQSKMKQLFRYRKNSSCFNCPDRRVNCHAHCERYQAEVSKNEVEKAEAMKIYQVIWDLAGCRRDKADKFYRRFKRR